MTLPLPDWQQQLASLTKMPDGFCVVDAQGLLLGANEAFCTLAGRTQEVMLGRSFAELSLIDSTPALMAEGNYRARWQRPDGSRINVEISSRRNGNGTTLCWVHDITDLITATQAMRRSQAFFEFLIEANALIARADEADGLYRDICALATRLDERIVLAWVGLLDPATGKLGVVAHAGPASGYIDGIFVSIDPDLPEGRGPGGRAMRENRLVVINHFDRDTTTQPWHERAQRHGITANASLPFCRAGKPIGALLLYSSEPAIFDQELARLLSELSTTLSHAIDYFAQRNVARLAAEALRQSERRHRLLADNVRDVIWVHDLQTQRFTYVSRSVEKLRGYTAAETLQQSIQDALTPESTALVARLIEEDLNAWDRGDYSPRTIEVEQRCKDGGTVWTEIATQIVEDEETGHLQVFGVTRDISGRRAAEHRFQEVWDLTTEGIAMIDDKGILVLVNRRFHDVLGYPEGYLAGHTMLEFLAPEDKAHFGERFQEIASGRRRETRDARYTLLHRDGHRIVVLLSATHRYDDNDRYIGSVGMVTDISALMATENELRKNLAHQQELNTKLEEAHNQLLQSEKMASIGQLAAGVAHELNNPIGFVHSNLGTLDTYLRDIFEIADAYEAAEAAMGDSCPALDHIRALKEHKDYSFLRQDIDQLMAESKDGLQRVRKIVQDLKDFSRVGDTHWQWTDIHQGLESTLNIVWNELKYKSAVTKHYAQDLPQIYCLPSQLNQVFMNLLVNAAHAIEPVEGKLGEITITTRRLSEDAIQIEFRDTGKGIPEENLKRIFEPFFTTKPVGKGTGLGLSITWGIIGRHQGHIDVQSTVGVGTTFTITLPVQGGQADAITASGDAVSPAPTFPS